jgi:hypothetical protein
MSNTLTFTYHMKLRKVGFVVEKVAMGRVSLCFPQFSYVNIKPLLLYTYSSITETITV